MDLATATSVHFSTIWRLEGTGPLAGCENEAIGGASDTLVGGNWWGGEGGQDGSGIPNQQLSGILDLLLVIQETSVRRSIVIKCVVIIRYPVLWDFELVWCMVMMSTCR